jgi:RNA recognition motif-containing protein
MGKKLFVGNLSYDTTGEDLKELFSQAGTCESASVITDRATGRSRGFGFVEMSTAAEAERATNELNGHELQGRRLTVSEARERTGGGGGGGGGGRSFGGGGGGGGGGRPGGMGGGRRRY